MYEAPESLRALSPRDLETLGQDPAQARARADALRSSVVPRFLTDHEHAVLAAAADRLIPPLDAHPGRRRARRRRLRRPPARRVHVRSAADLRGRPVQRPRRRRGVVRASSCRSRRTRSSRGARASKGRAASPEREFNGPTRGWQDDLPRRHRRARRRLLRRRRRRAGPPAARATASCAPLLYAHACEGAYGAPEYGGNRDLAGWRAIEFAGRRAAARLHRRRGERACLKRARLRRGRHRHRPGRRDRGRRAHRRGLVGDHAREGPQPPARARRAVRRARSRLERRDQVPPPPLPRPRSVPRAPHLPPRRRTTATACSRARSTTCRRRSAAAASTPTASSRAFAPSTSRPAPSSGRSRAPTSSTGRSTTTRWSRTTPRPNGSSASPGDAGAQPVRGMAQRAVPDAARRRHVRRGAHHRSRDAARLPPVPRADRRELGSVRRPARVQQLRVLRRTSAARSTPRAIRSRRCATRCAPAAARSAPSRIVERVLLDATGQHGARRALPRRRRQRARGDARASWSSRAARGRRRGCCCAPRSRTRRASSAATSCTTSRRS